MSLSQWGFHWPSYLKYILCVYLVSALDFGGGVVKCCCWCFCRYYALECKPTGTMFLTINNQFSKVSTDQLWHAIPLSAKRVGDKCSCPKALSHHWKFHSWKYLGKNIGFSSLSKYWYSWEEKMHRVKWIINKLA